MIILGGIIRANKVVDQRIVNLLDKADFNGVKIGDLLLVLSVFIIIVGVFTLILAADGGVGACFRIRWLLILVSTLKGVKLRVMLVLSTITY